MKSLRQAQGFILDMDGTFFGGWLPGGLEFLLLLNRLRSRLFIPDQHVPQPGGLCR